MVTEIVHRRIQGEADGVRYQCRLMRRASGLILCEIQGRRVLSRGRPAVLGTAVEVADRRRGHEEVRRLREALLRSERLATIGELLGGVAHELSSPLSVIMGQAMLLAGSVPEGPIAERARRIAAAAERAGRIVHNILDTVRDQPPARQHVAVNQLVREAVEVMSYRLRMSDVQV